MARSVKITLLFVIAALVMLGCSHGNTSPTEPDDGISQVTPRVATEAGRILLGEWRVQIDPRSSRAVIEPVRMIAGHEGNLLDYEDVQIAFDPGTDWNGWFGIWNLQVSLENTLTDPMYDPLYDVRGIIYVAESAGIPGEPAIIGIHNADGLTTLWTDNPYPPPDPKKNPFVAFGDIEQGNASEKNYQIEFARTAVPLVDCSLSPDDQYPPPRPYAEWIPDPGYWDCYLEDVFEFYFVVDASVGDHCEEPYRIDNFQQPVIPAIPGHSCAVSIDVYDWQDDVAAVMLDVIGEPGFTAGPFHHQSGNTWTGTIVLSSSWTKEWAIVEGRFNAISLVSGMPDPISNPMSMYKDIRIQIGDIDQLLDDLFSVPTQQEEDKVRIDWLNRDLTPYLFQIEDMYVVDAYGGDYPQWRWDDAGTMYFLVSHFMLNPDTQSWEKHYGSVRIPPGMHEPESLPVLLYTHWAHSVHGTVPTQYAFPWELRNACIQVLPAYRGNSICFHYTRYPLGGPVGENSPGDYDVDDSLALLEGVLENEAFYMADPERAVVMGGSRGGSPAMMAKIRDSLQTQHPPRLDGVLITVGSVTDFFMQDDQTAPPEFRESARHYIDFGYDPDYHYYNADYCVYERALDNILAGNMTIEQGRNRMLLTSPLYFATEDMQKIQMHHGLIDSQARVRQTEELEDTIGPYQTGITEFLYYDADHGIPGNAEPVVGSPPQSGPPGYQQRIYDFLMQVFS
jgi:acetyl esterase/lipase